MTTFLAFTAKTKMDRQRWKMAASRCSEISTMSPEILCLALNGVGHYLRESPGTSGAFFCIRQDNGGSHECRSCDLPDAPLGRIGRPVVASIVNRYTRRAASRLEAENGSSA
jgi:hypothetical protein